MLQANPYYYPIDEFYYIEINAWFVLLLTSFILFIIGYAIFSRKSEILNNLTALSASLFVFMNIVYLLQLMGTSEDLHNFGTNIFFMRILSAPILLIWITMLISTIIITLYKHIRKSTENTEVVTINRKEMSKWKRDVHRKISHVLIFVMFFVIWMIGYSYVRSYYSEGTTWVGMIPENNNMLELYIGLISGTIEISEGLLSLGWFYYLIFFVMYVLCLIMLVNEICRKSGKLAFPFTCFPQYLMSQEEKEGYGTYLLFAIGQMFAAFLCPPMMYLSILGMSAIADLMTSQIGIRFGKHKIRWNDDKSWEGSIAGILTSLVICYFFVGIIWAIILSVAFMAFDIFTRKPFNISDNLLIPIGASILFILIRYIFELDYVTPILTLL